MTAAGYTVTGPVIAGDSTRARSSTARSAICSTWSVPGPCTRCSDSPSRSRGSRIPLLIGLDIIHGHRTLFPIPLAEAAHRSTKPIWERTAREAAREGAADGLAMTFAPMLDVSRDPRWGRTAEGPGEDPWLTARIAQAKVRGFQGDRSVVGRIASRHVRSISVAYGAVTAGREYAAVDISERALREVHLPALRGGGSRRRRDAHAGLHRSRRACPMTAHIALAARLAARRAGLRRRASSATTTRSRELIKHGVAADLVDAAVLALEGRRRHRHDGRRLSQGPAGRARAGPRRRSKRSTRACAACCGSRSGSVCSTTPIAAARHRSPRRSSPSAARWRATSARRAVVMLKNERDTLPLPAAAKALMCRSARWPTRAPR